MLMVAVFLFRSICDFLEIRYYSWDLVVKNSFSLSSIWNSWSSKKRDSCKKICSILIWECTYTLQSATHTMGPIVLPCWILVQSKRRRVRGEKEQTADLVSSGCHSFWLRLPNCTCTESPKLLNWLFSKDLSELAKYAGNLYCDKLSLSDRSSTAKTSSASFSAYFDLKAT